ncbi:response regulator transcription factor [Microbacterium sediminicola]|uniref:Response regulator transcription factor n=1 Tax=Microbacterium sediminicola TaxID=415210 RepID=A0ABN2IC63_9MICO
MRPIAEHPLFDQHAQTAVIVEGDHEHAERLTLSLSQRGFTVRSATTGFDAVSAVTRFQPDLVIVGTQLSGLDEFETVRRIRRVSDCFIMMISADDSESAVVEGFRCGADDHVAHPYGQHAMRARIEALLRRSHALRRTVADEIPEWLEHGPLRLHPASRRVEVEGRDCDLTRSEFAILHALLKSRNRVFSKSALSLLVREATGIPGDHVTAHDRHAVEVHVMNLRRKLDDDPHAPLWIETVRGLGYRLAPEEAHQQARFDTGFGLLGAVG